MQIILMDKVTNLGNLGDLVKVKDGYARNYLIPQGKAKRATPAALAEFEARRVELEMAAADKLMAAKAFATKFEGLVLNLVRKAGVDGRLFGSVTNNDIVASLKEQGFELEKSAINMSTGPIKTIGESTVGIILHTDVHTEVKVVVVPEQ